MMLRSDSLSFGRTFFTGLLFSLLSSAPAWASDNIFRYDGDKYAPEDLPPKLQQQLFDIEYDRRNRTIELIDQWMLDRYFDEEAKKTGKPRKDVESKALTPDPLTDKEIKTWFDANKDRLPPGYSFEFISGEISSMLRDERKKKKRNEVLTQLRDKGKLELYGSLPQPPKFNVDIKGFPFKGEENAKLTLVEFADYQCPHCQHASGDLDKLLAMSKYKGKVKLVYIDYPFNPSGISRQVAYGAYCAEQQKKFWEYHDLAFKDQVHLGMNAATDLAKKLKLNEADFKKCMETKQPAERVERGLVEAEKVGVSGTPTMVLNGTKLKNYEIKFLEAAFDQLLAD